jgi:dethiobiotin synthetase/adenosylmethionine--8-amino-7-oxononanoate aminotransferase
MDASDQSIFNTAVDWYRGRGHWFSPPAVTIQNGQVQVSPVEVDNWPAHPMKDSVQATGQDSGKHHWSVDFGSLDEVYDVEARLQSDLAKYYTRHIRHTLERVTAEIDPVTGRKRQFGALILEPICLGAGGMVFVDPLFQRCLMDVVRSSADLFGKETEVVTEDGAWQGLPVVFDEGVLRIAIRGNPI